MILGRATRPAFRSLLDAAVLRAGDEQRAALVVMATGSAARTVSRREFRDEVRSYAAALGGLGVGAGDLVIIAHGQGLDAIYAFWGAMAAGAVPSMFPTLTEKLDELIYMSQVSLLVEHSSARIVLTSDELARSLAPRVSCPVYGSSDLAVARRAGMPPPIAFAPDPKRIALLQHSSGTTGLQKGVALAHEAVLNQLASLGDRLDLRDDDVVVSWLPLYHDMGLIAGFLLPLVQGIPLVIMSPFDWVAHPALLLRAIHEHHGTLCWLPNFAYNHCVRRVRPRDLEGLSLATMRAFVNCSEPVRAASHEAFLARFAAHGVRAEHFGVSYAMAENVFAVTQTLPGRPPRVDIVERRALDQEGFARLAEATSSEQIANVSCGPVIDGSEVRVQDESGRLVPERTVGQIVIRSDYMLTGYYLRPDLDAAALREGWYLTGDMGYLADGEVYVVGRKKDLIINGGRNLYPQDIEAIVGGVPGVHVGRAVAFGVPDEREGTELIAVVAEVDDPDADTGIAQAIREAVSAQAGVTATYVRLVDSRWLIKTSSGKMARAANRDKWAAERAAETSRS
jgi:acyl-CoA synthetase (AMP-forming)/AMP-acid ligase II